MAGPFIDFSLLATYIVSDTVRGGLQGGGFQVSFGSIAPNTVSEVCPVFSNWVFTYKFWQEIKGCGDSLC